MPKTLLDEYKANTTSQLNVRTSLNNFNELLHKSNGFYTGLYDLTTCPGNIGKWDLIFDIILNLLQDESNDGKYKILIIETYFSIPWLKLKNDKRWNKEKFNDKIKIVKAKTINELLFFFKMNLNNKYFNNENNDFKFILIDGFSYIYQKNLNELIHLNSVSMSNKNSNSSAGLGDLDDITEDDKVMRNMKRDYMGNPIPHNSNNNNNVNNKRINSLKTINLIIHNFMILLKKLIDENEVIILTTGLMNTINQKFYKPSKNFKKPKLNNGNNHNENDLENDNNGNGSEEEEEEEEEFLNQPTLIPMLPLIGPWSSYYTNRIILYKDWYNHKTKSKGLIKLKSNDKLSVNLTIDYLSQFNNGDLKNCLNYLIYSINNLNNLKEFRKGIFQIDEVTNEITDISN